MTLSLETFEPVRKWSVHPGKKGLVESDVCISLFKLAIESGSTVEACMQAPDLLAFCNDALDLTIQKRMREGFAPDSSVTDAATPADPTAGLMEQGAVIL